MLPEGSQHRKERKRGNRLGFWIFQKAVRLFGLRGAYGLLYIVSCYYLLFDRSAVDGALPYVKRRFQGCGFMSKYGHVYRLFVEQGKQLIDRYTLNSGHRIFDVDVLGFEDLMRALQDSRNGMILLTSHVGNWQLAMTSLPEFKRTVHLLMRPENNAAVQKSLGVSNENGEVKVISSEEYLGGVVQIMDALKEGDIVSIMGDRRYGAKAIDITFLGEKAWFPFGAFSIAASAQCPIVLLLSAKIGLYKYSVDLTNVLYPRYQGRHDKIGQLRYWVQEYGNSIERFVERYPYQCFLFQDIWNG